MTATMAPPVPGALNEPERATVAQYRQAPNGVWFTRWWVTTRPTGFWSPWAEGIWLVGPMARRRT
jgi:hypothetical protein